MSDCLSLIPLFSSSHGNSTLVNCNGSYILIDCGITCKKTGDALLSLGIAPDDIEAIFVTHGHTDHIKGIDVFVRKYHTPVYATANTHREIQKKCTKSHPASEDIVIEENEIVEMPFAAEVMAFPTPHDIGGSVCYKISNLITGKSVGVFTDLGHLTPGMKNFARGVDAILVESNYDPDMLTYGDYPYVTQQRIRGDGGHLSNLESAEFIEFLIDSGTKNFIIGHLSPNNNTEKLARDTIEDYLALRGMKEGVDYNLKIADKFQPTEGYTV